MRGVEPSLERHGHLVVGIYRQHGTLASSKRSTFLQSHHISRQYTMVSVLTILAFVASTLAVAVEDSELTLKVLLKRQESTSGAQYQCHADCGKSLERQT